MQTPQIQASLDTYSIRHFFAGKGILVTGSTGFLAKALVEKILRVLPGAGKIFLLIRPRTKADGSRVAPRERLYAEILRNSAFSRLRAQMGARFEPWCQERIVCVPGDLSHPRLGLDAEAYADLARQVQVVIGSAATVVFDERLDLALEINTLSPARLLEFAQAAGASYVHISTAYVSGMRSGLIPERLLEPLEAIHAQLSAGAPRPKNFQVQKEIEKLKTLCKIIQADCETQAGKNGWAPESEEARTALHRALVSAGMRRARGLGWNDTYTYTKFLGEQQVLRLHGTVPTAIVRPSIIESSLRDPEPGWLDGLRMADPLIIGFGKGRLADFPARKNVVLDIIPADLVVNAILASAAGIGGKEGAFELIHVASSSENPLLFETLYHTVRDYFQKHPMLDRTGKPVHVPHWRFPTVEHFKRRVTYGYLRPVKVVGALIDGPVPLPGTRRLRNRLRLLHTALEQLLYYVDIYSPYTNLDCRFETARARALLGRMLPEERDEFDFDPRKIPWRHYLQDVHIPGLKRNILRMEAPPRAGAGEGRLLDEEAEKTRTRVAAAIHGVPQTIVELAARGADRFGGKPFLELRRVGGALTQYTFAEFFERSGTWARTLRARLDLHSGDRVVLWSENCPEWCLAYLAIVRAGATAVPLDRQMPAAEVARLTQLVEAKALILSPAQLASAGAACGAGQGLPPRLNLLAGLEPHAGDAWTFPQASLGDRPLQDPSPETLASILFTSGTSQTPKGVMLSQVNFLSNALAVAEVLEPLQSDHFLSVLPLHHAFEFTGGFLAPLFGGSTVHHLESLRAKDVLETMKRAGITVVLGVPRLFQLFADGIQARLREAGVTGQVALQVLSGMAGAAELLGGERTRKRLFAKVHDGFGGKLRLFVSGGAALDPELFEYFRRFGITIAEGYGLTETAPILTVNPLGAPKSGSVGLPLPGVEVKVSKQDIHGVGEVLARGPMIMQGYWRQPEATEQAMEEGWFRTGDLGRFDAAGYLYITGRLKEVIVTSAGKKIYPDELEARFRSLPKAKEVCTVGLPARQGQGEEPALVVVLEADDEQARAAVHASIERINQGLPGFQRVARVEFQTAELPKTSTFKVRRMEVRNHYVKSSSGKFPAVPVRSSARAPVLGPEEQLLAEVVRAAAEVSGLAAASIGADQKLQLDLGLDSIGRVDLIGKLELRLNVSIPDEVMARLWTIRDVAGALRTALGEDERAPVRSGKALAQRAFQGGRKKDAAAGVLAPTLSKTLMQGAMRTTENIFFNAYLGIDAFGLEHLPSSGAYILAANHSSHLDTAAIRAVLGPRSAQLHVMGAKDYFFDTRLKSWFFSSAFNVLPFDREENTLDGLALCRAVLDEGKALLIFPEGTRSTTGDLQSFKPGIGILALELNVPVVPVYLKGTFESLPKGRTVPRPSRVAVRFGPAVDFGALKERKAHLGEVLSEKKKGGGSPLELYRQAAELIRASVERLVSGE